MTEQEAMEPESAQRKAARIKMKNARRLFEGKHPEQGVEAMKEVLELDPEFIEPRKWLADYYASTDQKRLAVSQYEEMLRLEPDNLELWEGLRKVDPVTADRLERLRNVAPDPFVAEGKGVDMSDLDDFEDVDEEPEPDQEKKAAAPFKPAPAEDDDLFIGEGDEEGYEPLPWEHEQDATFREQVEQNPAFQDVMDGCQLFWEDPQGWSHLLGEARAPEDSGWNMIGELGPAAAADLHAQIPTILVAPGHAKCPIPMPLKNPTLVLSESQRFALGNQEVLFALGMGTHGLLNANAEICWGCQVICERELDCELRERVLHNASEFAVGWDEALPRDEVKRIRKLCHAYELRAVLSADRAGLIACGNIGSSLRAISALVAEEGDGMSATPEDLEAEFEDVPANKLAAIPVAHDPWTDRQYAAYRIKMLRWWATTDDFKKAKGR
jgi:tetratricopeptide (TPR) repeat protein